MKPLEKRMLVALGVVILVVLAAGIYTYYKLIPTSTVKEYSNVTITLQRTACYGTCPVYALKIDADGTVTYTGEWHVKVMGERVSQISKEQVAELVDAFYAIDYFSLKDEYTYGITDLPTTFTSITVDGRSKKIQDYYGAPESLRDLEDKIDEITNSQQWVK